MILNYVIIRQETLREICFISTKTQMHVISLVTTRARIVIAVRVVILDISFFPVMMLHAIIARYSIN